MRMRRRNFVTISLAFFVIVILLIGYFSKIASEHDAFITLLPPKHVNKIQTLRTEYLEWLPDHQQQEVKNNRNLLNITNFKYLLNNNLCNQYGKEFLAILIITSYAGHDALRSAHRQAISESKLIEMGFLRVFLLAAIPKNEEFITKAQLNNEQKRFGDLLQGNFIEAYRNLSYKHIMGLQWASNNCRQAKFIIKLDDDIVYDIFHLKRYLETIEVKQPTLSSSSLLLAGYVLDAKSPIRNVASKWYVTKQEYEDDMYPSYLSGWLYITNAATAMRLVAEAHRSQFFWIDDTWLTGILRSRLGIPIQRCNEWYSANAEFLECCVRDLKQSNYECEYYVGPNGGDNKLLIEFLHNVEKCYFDECNKRPTNQTLKQTCVAKVKSILPEHGKPQIQKHKLR